ELARRLEAAAIERNRRAERLRREVRGERVRQPQLGRELGAEQARPEDPDRHVRAGAGNGLHHLSRLRRPEVRLQLEDVLRERVRRYRRAPKREQRALIGAGRAAETEVDAARIERLERAELLGNQE